MELCLCVFTVDRKKFASATSRKFIHDAMMTRKAGDELIRGLTSERFQPSSLLSPWEGFAEDFVACNLICNLNRVN